jgi:signal recognition particle GTPase
MENNLLIDINSIAKSIGNLLNYLPSMIEEKKSEMSEDEKAKANIEIEKLEFAKKDFFQKVSKLQNIGK